MANSLVLCICLIFGGISVAQAQPDRLCEDPCVVDVYSEYCGGARCLHDSEPNREQFLCRQTCLDALEGTAFLNCLQNMEMYRENAREVQLNVTLEAETFCAAFETLFGPAVPPEFFGLGPVAAEETFEETLEEDAENAVAFGSAIAETPEIEFDEFFNPAEASESEIDELYELDITEAPGSEIDEATTDLNDIEAFPFDFAMESMSAPEPEAPSSGSDIAIDFNDMDEAFAEFLGVL